MAGVAATTLATTPAHGSVCATTRRLLGGGPAAKLHAKSVCDPVGSTNSNSESAPGGPSAKLRPAGGPKESTESIPKPVAGGLSPKSSSKPVGDPKATAGAVSELMAPLSSA